jgi:hypothetical protein
MIIYGAGMAGLLAANILRRHSPVVKEAQSELPNNHSALLRFRTPSVGDSCGIPFKKVFVNKAVNYENKMHTEPNVFFTNSYSQKVTGAVENRSINNLSPSTRYIAPINLIGAMAADCKIEYNQKLTADALPGKRSSPVISTIPMPAMMKIVGWDAAPDFRSQQIWTHIGLITDPDVDVYQTIYYPDPMQEHYRVSIIGRTVIAEHTVKPTSNPGPNLMPILRDDFGIQARNLTSLKSNTQKYGKILPIDERLRKEFIFYLTKEHGIYSLGRFATWRQLLLDDIVPDIAIIDKFISQDSDSAYDASLLMTHHYTQTPIRKESV